MRKRRDRGKFVSWWSMGDIFTPCWVFQFKFEEITKEAHRKRVNYIQTALRNGNWSSSKTWRFDPAPNNYAFVNETDAMLFRMRFPEAECVRFGPDGGRYQP